MQNYTHNSHNSSGLPVGQSRHSHHKRPNHGKHHGVHQSSSQGADTLTGGSTGLNVSADALTHSDSPVTASGIKGQVNVFHYQNLSSSKPFDISDFNYSEGDRIVLPGPTEDVWRQYNIQYQVTPDGINSQVMQGNQLVGTVHAQIGITSLI
jgi:hypothetical protein